MVCNGQDAYIKGTTALLSKPQAIAATVGSLMILETFMSAITPASLAACLSAPLPESHNTQGTKLC
jgi:hypothetical protein